MSDPEVIPIIAEDGVSNRLTAFDEGELSADSPVLLVKPALGVRASFYAPLAAPFAEIGMRIVTADLRGHGESAVRPGRTTRFGYREMVESDLPAEVDALEARYPDAPILLLGHSLGGQLSLLFAATHPGRISAVVGVATCSVYWRAYPAALRLLILLGTQLTPVIGGLVGHFPGDRLGFGGKESVGLMRDWARQARTGLYEPAGSSVDYEAALRQSRVPALLATLPGDHYAPASAADHLAGKLDPRVVTRRNLGEPRIANPHFGWVRQAESIAPVVGDWWLEVQGE
ncbi:MAG: alpha/beta fold hydrolase [Xanthomonadales bacterium]|nr:alpha/beta fold hydrolase [Xanthomonadales bacterium]